MVFTFICYTSYHLSRKPISVVKNILHRNCSIVPNDTSCDWIPFDGPNYLTLLGSLDYAFLFAYAVGMFISGHIAERMNLRHFLSAGMILTGILTAAFGFGFFLNIHTLAYYIIVQILCGFLQATGWPSVVTFMGNWFGKGNRGLIMGIWNSHTSVGNILGSVIAGQFVDTSWGWSFIVPGIIIAVLGITVFFFLVPHPEDVGCDPPEHITRLQKEKMAEECTEDKPLIKINSETKPISFKAALKIPGVVEFSLCLFFAKLVSYTFLFWLPNYIKHRSTYDPEQAADMSTLFDVGGIFGGIIAGFLSDKTNSSGGICMLMLAAAAPLLYVYNEFGHSDLTKSIILLLICGIFVNGPYALITTAVSADLGTHQCLAGNSHALATVTAIIDGTGSMGAALGPLLTGILSQGGWDNVFYMLITADICAFLLLTRVTMKEIRSLPASTRKVNLTLQNET